MAIEAIVSRGNLRKVPPRGKGGIPETDLFKNLEEEVDEEEVKMNAENAPDNNENHNAGAAME